jgi:hypothetical protein
VPRSLAQKGPFFVSDATTLTSYKKNKKTTARKIPAVATIFRNA